MEIGFGKNRGCVDITSDGCFNDVDTVNKKGNLSVYHSIFMVKSIEYNSYYQLEIDFTLAVDCGVILANKNYNVAIFVNILYIAHSTWNIIDCF